MKPWDTGFLYLNVPFIRFDTMIELLAPAGDLEKIKEK